MYFVYALLFVFAALFVTAWIYCQWLGWREARPGSVRATRLRLSLEKSEYLEEGLCAIAQVDFHNSGRHAVKLSGEMELLANGQRLSNKVGNRTTDFFNVIAPAGGISTLEIVGTRIVVLSDNQIEGTILYDFEYEISEKKAQTSQKTGGKITFHGKADVQNIPGPMDIEFEVGPDVYDQYR